MALESPEFSMEIESVSTVLSAEGLDAEVHLQVTLTGRPPGLTRSAMGVVTWRCRQDQRRWYALSHHGFLNFIV